MKKLIAILAICGAATVPARAQTPLTQTPGTQPLSAQTPLRQPTLTLDALNAATWPGEAVEDPNPLIFKAQVLLDRAGFSPGVIDARDGENLVKAVTAFQSAAKLPVTGKLDELTWRAIDATSREPVAALYAITPDDVAGPFVANIPHDYLKMGTLKRLAYRGPRELLAEKFHMDEDLLQALAGEMDFTTPGRDIVVANVYAKPAETRTVAKIEIDKTERSLRALDAEGKLIAFYPASVGSEEKPAPSGTHEVRGVAKNPTYRYNPAYAFKGQKATEPVEIAPGPNNPVGAVWIALSVEGYGIHGTPEPSKVSKSASHGCVRLTNWDALALAAMVPKGTRVDFRD